MKELPQSSNIYQVYFFTCPAHKPFHLGRHPWAVTVSPTGIYRWEIIKKHIHTKEHFGYVHKNYYANPTQGIRKFSGSSEFWESTLLGSITGNKHSLAERMVDFIHIYSKDYLHKDSYNLYPGPNSNTYINWILKKFPEAKVNLPWNCFGKNY
jgi:hypothetical protein